MTGGAPAALTPERVYRGIHILLTVAVLVVGAVFILLARAAPAAAPNLTQPFRLAAALELAAVIIVLTVFRRRITSLEAADEPDAWWVVNGPRAIILWALAEGTAMIGVVFWHITRDALVVAVLGGFGLAALVAHRPSRLLE